MTPTSGYLKSFDFLSRVPVCPKNIEHVVMLSERYDAYACLQCNVWLGKGCDDPACDYCVDRPKYPKEAP